MNSNRNLEKRIMTAGVATHPVTNKRMLDNVLKAFKRSKACDSSQTQRKNRNGNLRRRLSKFAAALAIGLTVLAGMRQCSGSTSALAGMLKNVEQMPWFHAVITEDGDRAEEWVSEQYKVRARKVGDGRITFISGEEQKEYLYDPSKNKIFVSSAVSPGRQFSSPLQFTRHIIRMLESSADGISTETKLIDGIRMEISGGTVPSGEQAATMKLYRDVARNLLARLEITHPDESVVMVLDYPERGPLTVYDLGVSRDVEVVNLVSPPELSKVREDIERASSAAQEPYVALSLPCEVKELPDSFSGPGNAIIGIWHDKKNWKWRCNAGYFTADTIEKLEEVNPEDDVQYWVQSIVPAVSHIVNRGKVYTQIAEDLGDGNIGRLEYHHVLRLSEIFWPRLTGTVGVPVNWKVDYVTGPDGESLIFLERAQDGRVPNEKGRHVKPTRNRWYFNPGRDYICQRHEIAMLLNGDWITNKHWLEGEDNPRYHWAGSDYETTTEVLEYAQTPSGRWYPRVVKETHLIYDRADGESSVDPDRSSSTCRKIYLQENPDFPAWIFDPKTLP